MPRAAGLRHVSLVTGHHAAEKELFTPRHFSLNTNFLATAGFPKSVRPPSDFEPACGYRKKFLRCARRGKTAPPAEFFWGGTAREKTRRFGSLAGVDGGPKNLNGRTILGFFFQAA